MSDEVIQKWLDDMSYSVATRDLSLHMSLVSQRVQVYGVPGHRHINYMQWFNRRRNEFEKGLLIRLSYKLVNIKTKALRRLGFRVEEVMTAANGQAIWLEKDIILELEVDEKWRVVEEHIRQWHLKEI